MKRKAFILLILSILISFSTISFANMANDVKNTVNGATNTVVDGSKNLVEDIRNGIGNAENAVENGAQDIGTAITDGANDIMGTNNNINNTNNTNNSGYTVARTTTADAIETDVMTSSMWTWIIIAIAGAVIVGLVWYYAVQHTETH